MLLTVAELETNNDVVLGHNSLPFMASNFHYGEKILLAGT